MEQHWKTELGHEKRDGGQERETKSSGKEDLEREGQEWEVKEK